MSTGAYETARLPLAGLQFIVYWESGMDHEPAMDHGEGLQRRQ